MRAIRTAAILAGIAAASTAAITVSDSYSTGRVTGGSRNLTRGGFVGATDDNTYVDNYWDTDKSGYRNIHRGAGNVKNETGIVGVSNKKLRSGLPPGFDPSIWAEDKKFNDGLPNLLANPPH